MPLPPRIARTLSPHLRRERDGMDANHLANLRQCPCLGCGREPSSDAPIHAHHLMAGMVAAGMRGKGLKAPDKIAVPLCFWCHDQRAPDSVHRHGDDEQWLLARAIDGRAAAAALWAARGDLVRMRRVVFHIRQEAFLKRARNAGAL